MAAVITYSVPVPAFALLLLTLLPPALAQSITTPRCDLRGGCHWCSVRQYPDDYEGYYLWLNKCGFTEFTPSDDYQGLHAVKYIFLNDNDMTRINTTAFRAVPSLSTLVLGQNKLKELPVFEDGSCSRLTEILVHDNSLTGIYNARTFKACSQLEDISLSNNNIEYIHPDVFSTLTKLKALYLNKNKLTVIPEGMFKTNKLKLLNIMQNRISYLPSDLVNALNHPHAIIETLFNFHENPIHCGCLLESLKELKRAYISYYEKRVFDYEDDIVDVPKNIAPYDGTRPMCVFVGRYPCYRHTPSGMLPGTSH